MAKAKISSKDFLDLLDEQNDQPAPAAGSFGRVTSSSAPPPIPGRTAAKSAVVKSEPELATNWQQTGARTNSESTTSAENGNKPAINREQTGNKVGTQPATNRQQSGYKAYTENPASTETGNKVGTQPATLSATKWQQTGNKPATNPTFSALVGLQRALIVFLYEACKTTRARATDALTLEHMATCLNTRSGSVKTTLQRLEAKGYVLRVAFKNGRGGWSKYELPDTLFHELLKLETGNKPTTNWQQTGHKVDTQPATEPATSLSSSSSSIDSNQNFKTTTTGEVELFEDGRVQLSPDWDSVDFSALADMGFSRAHLTQLAKHGKLSSSEVQDSIHFFAFDLRQNGKGRELKGPPLNFFMGILRKGLPYAPPENYESPEAEARHKYLEGKRRLEERRLAEEHELKALAFAEWRRGLTESQARDLVPDAVKDIPRAREASLNVYFDEQVYPGLEPDRFGENATERAQVRAAIAQSLGEVQP